MSNRPALTPRQAQIYEYIRGCIENRGYGPTVREIGNGFRIKSPNGVMSHLKALEKKGYIKRESYQARAIQLTERRKITLPLVGTIAAGNPLAAFEQAEEIDFSWLFASKS